MCMSVRTCVYASFLCVCVQNVCVRTDEMECPLCMERAVTSVLNPCGHCFCCAEDCHSSVVTACPVCRQTVSSTTRVFGALVGSHLTGEEVQAAADSLAVAAAQAAAAVTSDVGR